MTATRAPQLFTCTCDANSEPHSMPVPRILVAAALQADPQRLSDALLSVWYDLTLFYGPEVPVIIAYEGEASGAAEAARDWAAAQGFAAESHDGETVAAHVVPEGVACAASEGRPVYRYAA